jgi:hypothetical protein
MTINELQDVIMEFALLNKKFLDASITPLTPYNVRNHFDPRNQRDYQKSGLYAYFSDSDREVLYVGIAQDFGSRLYQHMRKNMGNWCIPVDGVLFPTCNLLQDNLSINQSATIRNGDFSVQYFHIEPYQYAGLFEVFAIILADPPATFIMRAATFLANHSTISVAPFDMAGEPQFQAYV